MYLSHFGLHEAPFRLTPHTDFFFDGANRREILEALIFAITHAEGIIKVTGEIGTGKTMLCRVLLERLPKTVDTIYLANPSLSRDEILYTIADDLGLDLAGQRQTVALRNLHQALIERHAAGRQVVVLIDEAHAMPLESLEEVRLMYNLETGRHKLLQIVLFGQPELDGILAQPQMRQLKDRITQNFSVQPLSPDVIQSYLMFRMRTAGFRGPEVFSSGAIKTIARESRGRTRRINVLADKALLAAFVDNTHLVEPKHVRAAVKDTTDADGGPSRPATPWIAAGAAAAAAAVAVSAWHWFGGGANPAGSVAAPPAATSAGAVTVAPAAVAPPAVAASPAVQPASTDATAAPALPTPAAGPQAAGPATPAEAAPAGPQAAPAGPAAAPSRPVAPPPTAPASTAAAAPAAPASPPAAAPVLPALSAPPPAAPPAPHSPASHPAPGATPAPAPPRPQPGQSGNAEHPLLAERLEAGRGLLKSGRDRHSVQLFVTEDFVPRRVERFLQRARASGTLGDIYVFSFRSGDRTRLRVTWGSFPGPEEASAATSRLPAKYLADFDPKAVPLSEATRIP